MHHPARVTAVERDGEGFVVSGDDGSRVTHSELEEDTMRGKLLISLTMAACLLPLSVHAATKPWSGSCLEGSPEPMAPSPHPC